MYALIVSFRLDSAQMINVRSRKESVRCSVCFTVKNLEQIQHLFSITFHYLAFSTFFIHFCFVQVLHSLCTICFFFLNRFKSHVSLLKCLMYIFMWFSLVLFSMALSSLRIHRKVHGKLTAALFFFHSLNDIHFCSVHRFFHEMPNRHVSLIFVVICM